MGLFSIAKDQAPKAGAALAGIFGLGEAEDAEASLAKLAARGLSLKRTDTPHDYGTEQLFSLRANDAPSHEMARADMWNEPDGDLFAQEMFVNPEHRGSGLMSEMYDGIEETLGKGITPSAHLTPDGAKFWANRDPETLRGMLDDGTFDEWDSSDNVRSALVGKAASAATGTAGLLAAGQSEEADAGVTLKLAQGIDLDRLVGAWRKAVSREPDIHPSTHLEKIIHNKDFINYDDWAKYARNKDGGKNGETYFNELKPFLIDISKHPNVAKDKRLRLGLTDYANKRFAIRKAEGHKPDGPRGGQRGSADPYSMLPVAGIGAAAASLAAPHIRDSGMASAPRSETLGDVTSGLRDVERRLEGSPAALLFPDGLTNYLETVNRSTEDPNWLTRTMAALDFMP